MQVVIDSVSMHRLLRTPKTKSKSKNPKSTTGTPLDEYIRLGQLVIVLDSSRGLISEWGRTCQSHEVIQVLITRWAEFEGILLIQNPRSLTPAISRRLRILGFGRDTIDKLILRLALETKDRIIVSDESDFWDPTKPKNDPKVLGNHLAPVARLCREELKVTILLLKMLIERLQ